MAARLFGTDGVRGVANGDVLSPETALALGRASALFARERGAELPTVVVGRDTRRSGPMLEDALCAGIASAGGLALRAGVLPTPGVATLVRLGVADLGLVVSASHNPFPDNGIKLFGDDGYKLADAEEDRVVELMGDDGDLPTGDALGEVTWLPDAGARYADWVVERVGGGLKPRRVLVDCANGAASAVASRLFERLGVDAELINALPDGININERAGSTHLDVLGAAVAAGDYELGVAFDGDADRVRAVTASGEAVDGDQIVAILARDLARRGRLPGDLVVVTSMSNLGFHRAMRRLDLETAVTDVGDRYVLEEMRARGAELGGEQSGHVIALGFQTTGDGLVTAALLLGALDRAGETLEQAAGLVTRFPQKLVNVRARREGLPGARAIWDVVERENVALEESGAGRIVLRASGAGQLVRVMVEHEDPAELDRICDAIVALVEQELGTA